MKVFCIPGFGTDEKMFSKLNFSGLEPYFLNWIPPLPQEPLRDYARRLSQNVSEENPTFIGISFGGMMALEIAKIRDVKQIILISSVKSRKELPSILKLIGFLRLNRIFPVKTVPQNDKLYEVANKRLGAVTAEEKSFANSYRKTADLNYVNWSFEQILNWKNREYPSNILHIHGNKDQIFPIKNITPTHIIEGGTHMMAWNRANEISKIIRESLSLS